MFRNTYGLVLCGGQSSRMGADKSMLTYYEKPQRYHIYDMLQQLSEKVFISGKKNQPGHIEPGYSFLADDERYNDIGPLAALLTAFEKFPEKNILLIGCDYPFLTAADLENFSLLCTGEHPVSFYNEEAGIGEPLLAWYPRQLSDKLKNAFQLKQHSLKHFLKQNGALKFYPANKSSMLSIDTQAAFIQALQSIKAS